MDRPRFRAISAVTIATHDMRRAVRFYHALGLELASGGETAGAILVVFLIWLDVAWCIRLAGAAATDCHQHPATELARALHRGRAAARERLALRALAEVMHRYSAARRRAASGSWWGAPRAGRRPRRAGAARGAAARRRAARRRAGVSARAGGALGGAGRGADPGGGHGLPAGDPDHVAEILARRAAAEREGLEGLTLQDLAGG